MFNGIERVEGLEINIDMAVFRSYDPAIGRWWQVDPYAERYANMTPYNGIGNNPILFSDPMGDTINVSQIKDTHPDMWKTTKSDLEMITGLLLSVDDSGNLTYKEQDGRHSGSKKARKKLIKAIDSKSTVTVKGCNDCGSAVTTMDTDAPISNQNEFTLSEVQIKEFIDGTSSDLSNQTYGFGMNFLHELGHTKVGGRLVDWPEGNTSVIGSNVRTMNKIRQQLGSNYGQRVVYNPMNADPSSPYVYYAFSKGALNSLKKGQVPTSGFIVVPRN